MLRYSFRLFVSDVEGKDRAAIDNVQNLCAVHLQRDYEISVIDVNRRPDLAEKERILATPALVKIGPLPRQCVVGDLADVEEVLRALALWDENESTLLEAKDSLFVPSSPR
jgi:circadian clock protein KaiB